MEAGYQTQLQANCTEWPASVPVDSTELQIYSGPIAGRQMVSREIRAIHSLDET
jgi:hypothetical protein